MAGRHLSKSEQMSEPKIRDIVFRGEVDLANCESEPIHIPGSIQPHGILLALKQDTLTIAYCSANCEEVLKLKPEQILGKTLREVVGEKEFATLTDYLTYFREEQSNPYVLTRDGIAYHVVLHRSQGLWIMELEPFPYDGINAPDLYLQTKNFVRYIDEASTLRELCQKIAEETREVTGYDRVMIYRFDKDHNGEIFAEAKREDLEPFLGLNYPHTDIPAQARELYRRNLMRMIVDVKYTPVPILTLDTPEHRQDLDLSMSMLRSVSPMHLEYLGNMGVGGTLTISLMRGGQLWGLIACHHYSPLRVPYYARLAAKLQGHFLTSQIAVRETSEDYAKGVEIDNTLAELTKVVAEKEDFIREVIEHPGMREMVDADGVVMIYQKKYFEAGLVPKKRQVKQILNWLKETDAGNYFVTDKLSEHFPEAKEFSENASGLLYYSFGEPHASCILWFRQEIEKTIHWAGDPAKAVVKRDDAEGVRLSPRKSFALWKEQVKYQSCAWKKAETSAAVRLAMIIQNEASVRLLRNEEMRYRLQSEHLQALNEELETFNWISSHDLKEPLRMVSIYSQVIAQKGLGSDDEFVKNAAHHVNEGIGRMKNLIDSLLRYNKLGRNLQTPEYVRATEVVHAPVYALGRPLKEIGGRVEIIDVPETLYCIPVLFRQLIQNLVENAIKFRGENPLLITISCRQAGAFFRFEIKDNGIGIDAQYIPKMFKVFQRLHPKDKYEGSGMGLAICKRIVEAHRGTIWMESEEGKGTSVFFTLPVRQGE
jgi:light-regulated signal transduction histidine kinase (bacteriophytochrome)